MQHLYPYLLRKCKTCNNLFAYALIFTTNFVRTGANSHLRYHGCITAAYM